MVRKTRAAGPSGPHWFDAWTRDIAGDVTAEDLQRLLTHDTRDDDLTVLILKRGHLRAERFGAQSALAPGAPAPTT